MGEITARPRGPSGGVVRFYPSHLTKGLFASTVSFAFAVYAVREFAMVGKDKYPIVPKP